MGIVLQFSIPGDRCVGDDDVDTAGFHDLELELADPLLHLQFRVLEVVVAVADRAAKAQDADAFLFDEIVIDADTAFRRIVQEGIVMIAVDVEQRLV